MGITATQVKALREKTGAAMMDCKKALQAANGDIEEAIVLLRTRGEAKALKKSDRIAAEGVIALAQSRSLKQAAMIELNCETDFVARKSVFIEFAKTLAQHALELKAQSTKALLESTLADNNSVEASRIALVAKLGENITVRRVVCLEASSGILGAYTHGTENMARIGVLLALSSSENVALARDLAMHIAAMRPMYASEDQIPEAELAKEKAVILTQVEEQSTGKSKEILQRMVEGKLKKWTKEITLLGQPFVKEASQTVAQLLSSENAAVSTFVRFEVGEGIEKETGDFVQEVMSQVKTKQ